MSPQVKAIAAIAHRRVGTVLCDRYRVGELIGVGGMGVVYAGTHRNGHSVAIKILHERLLTDPSAERHFRREAQLANAVGHPGVVPVIDDDVTDDGCRFLVMPLLEGETLRVCWERRQKRLPVGEVVAIAHALLDILSAAHAIKIVHRDIKPENIFITCDDGVRMLDFGVARLFEDGHHGSTTGSGCAVGTPAFMAPEQALGRLRAVDGRTDLWAVGATIFLLLTGRLVHQAETVGETLVYAATRSAPPLADVAVGVPARLCAVVDRALAFEKDARWPDASAMNAALCEAFRSAFDQPLPPVPKAATRSRCESSDLHSLETRHNDVVSACGAPNAVPSNAGMVRASAPPESVTMTAAEVVHVVQPVRISTARRLRKGAVVALGAIAIVGGTANLKPRGAIDSSEPYGAAHVPDSAPAIPPRPSASWGTAAVGVLVSSVANGTSAAPTVPAPESKAAPQLSGSEESRPSTERPHLDVPSQEGLSKKERRRTTRAATSADLSTSPPSRTPGSIVETIPF